MENLAVLENTEITFVPVEEVSIEKIHFFKNTVHFKRRKHDKYYEVIAMSSGRPENLINSETTGNRWITLSVCKTHDEAMFEIKKFRH